MGKIFGYLLGVDAILISHLMNRRNHVLCLHQNGKHARSHVIERIISLVGKVKKDGFIVQSFGQYIR